MNNNPDILVVDISSNQIIYGLGGYNKPSGFMNRPDNINIDLILDKIILELNLKNPDIYLSHIYNQKFLSDKYKLKYYNRHTLSLLSICKNTGLVIDFNHNHTKILPIYSGLLLDSYIKYSNISLNKFTNLEKKQITELITDPVKYHLDCIPLHESIILCIKSLPIDLRKSILQNILIVGDQKITGIKIPDTLIKNIRKSYNPNYNMNINSPKTKIIQSWIGGSIMSITQNNSKVNTSKHSNSTNIA